jgi:hypothetical protein
VAVAHTSQRSSALRAYPGMPRRNGTISAIEKHGVGSVGILTTFRCLIGVLLSGAIARTLKRGYHPCNVCGIGCLEHLGARFRCPGELSAIPAQMFAHGGKRPAIAKALEVAGMLQGYPQTVMGRDVRWRRRRRGPCTLILCPRFSTKYPRVAKSGPARPRLIWSPDLHSPGPGSTCRTPAVPRA